MLVISVRQDANNARLDLQNDLAQELQTLPDTLNDYVLVGDYASLQQTLDRYAARTLVARVEFRDGAGTTLSSRHPPQVSSAPQWFVHGLDFHDVTGETPLDVGGRNYGDIVLSLTAQSKAARAWQRLKNQMAILLLAITLDFLGIWLILRTGLAPLQRLESGAEAIANGSLETRLTIEGSPELRRLIHSFNRMAAGLQNHQARLAQAHADLTRFAEVSAHHLMEPSRRLISYSQRLRVRLTALSQERDDEISATLGYIEHDASRLRVLVRDIQLYLAASEARGDIQEEDANEVIEALQKRLKPQCEALGATLSKSTLPPAVLDRPRLMDLFSVLLENALQHGRPAEASIPLQIRIDGERLEKLSRYRITDNGPGILAEYRERVFGIFERLGATGGEHGTGIGLSIARRIVESRHGKIWIENLPQGGTAVFFELPDGE